MDIRKDKYDVYVGRADRRRDAAFGNPFRVEEYGRAEALDRFAAYFKQRVENDAEFCRLVEALRGKTLGCFCAPPGGVTAESKPFVCHGQVIAEYLDGIVSESDL